MELVDGKKLVVYFGCFGNDSPEIENETGTMNFEELQKTGHAYRTKIVEGLRKSEEPRNLSELYAEVPATLLFNPVIFTIHISLSLQKPLYVTSENNSLTEDFECVFDGNLLLIAGLVDVDKVPFGAFDVRDRVTTILQKIVEVKKIPPCIHPRPISFITDKSQIPKELIFGNVAIARPMNSKTLLGQLYSDIHSDLLKFYELCAFSNNIDDQIEEIEARMVSLLKNMSGSSLTSWKQTLRRRGFAKARRKEMIYVLAELTLHQSYRNRFKSKSREFKTFYLPRARVIDDSDLKYYGTPQLTLGVDLMTKTVDYVRSELEGYSRNTYTLLSALAGAIVGSVITLLVRAILKI